MKIATTSSTKHTIQAVVDAYNELVTQLGAKPHLLMLQCSINYDVETLLSTLREMAPNIPLHGGTSCMGVMTESGFHNHDGYGLALFGIYDPEGSYGVGAALIEDDPSAAAHQATINALNNADCRGEMPAMVWMTAMPGCEEALIEGIEKLLGDDIPIAGGSSADNDVSAHWKQFANDDIHTNAVVISVFVPSSEIVFAFHSGYEPTPIHGIVTKAEGRILKEIDGRPAAEVYNEWVGGGISDVLPGGGNILASTTLYPLGRAAGKIVNVPYYQLSHPDAVTEAGELTLFSTINEGDELVLMNGTIDSLVSRAGRVAKATLDAHSLSSDDIAGALVIYCAGCMLTVKDRIDEVVNSMNKALPHTPFMGAFTFGEQGCFIGGENRHGNLMISVLMFSK